MNTVDGYNHYNQVRCHARCEKSIVLNPARTGVLESVSNAKPMNTGNYSSSLYSLAKLSWESSNGDPPSLHLHTSPPKKIPQFGIDSDSL